MNDFPLKLRIVNFGLRATKYYVRNFEKRGMMTHTQKTPLAMLPKGLSGRFFSFLMERMNRKAYQATFEALEAAADMRLLEVGFGTGAFLEHAVKSVKCKSIAGVDPSALMVETAKRRLEPYRGRFDIDLRIGDDRSLPWPGGAFDRITAIHSFQFWAAPEKTLLRIKELLAPDGLFCLTLRNHGSRPPDWLPNPVSREQNEVAKTIDMLTQAGFGNCTVFCKFKSSTLIKSSVL